MPSRSNRVVIKPTSALLIAACATVIGAGCAERRAFTIQTTPPDATVKINARVRGPLERDVVLPFSSPDQVYSIVASRYGYEDTSVPVTVTTPEGTLPIVMRPKVKPLTINVEPVPATLLLDGRPITSGFLGALRYDLPYSVDDALQTQTHTLRAERLGYAPAETTISYDDQRNAYTLRLGTLTKDLAIDTTPPGANVTLDGVDVGRSPVRLADQPFAYDAVREQFVPRVIVATKPGYPPTRVEIGWDDAKRDYNVPLGVFRKAVRIVTEPSDAKVTLDGKPLSTGPGGVRETTLEFRPIDEAGNLKTYELAATVDHPGEQWKPLRTTLEWDDGKPAVTLRLEEILVRNVPTRRVEFRFADGQWKPAITESTTTAWKDLSDAKLGKATRISDLPAGTSLESFTLSPDGSRLVYSLIEPDTKRPRARLFVRDVDADVATALTDGRHLDVMPAFNPAGDAVIFSSDRGGGPMQVWSIPLDGQSGITRLTAGNADHLWPGLDISPKPRVFYESLVPGQEQPRLYSTPVGTAFETDLIANGGRQPRLSPRNNAIAFVQTNDATGQTDIVRASDRGGLTQKLTDSADASERDPAWNSNGSRIAFTADRPASSTTRPAQTEILMIDTEGGTPRPVTQNDAIDDLPVWAPGGDAIYFRSNRGGKWDIWRIEIR